MSEIDPQQREEAAQRRLSLLRSGRQLINEMWEVTQGRLAMLTVGIALLVNGWLAVTGTESVAAMAQNNLAVLASIVIGFYFGRTNHARPTGTGEDSPPHDDPR